MQSLSDAGSVRALIRSWHGQGLSVGLVPTMGNLHAGHLALLKLAASRCDRVVASVFVNPPQFAPDDDYEAYPRTLAEDRILLAEHGCDLLFAPPVEVMYPFGVVTATTVHVPLLTESLEGAVRPQHFDGVCTVVSRLFNLVQPQVAVFGQKDYQQWRVVERMAADLLLPVKVLSAPVQRDVDGLALSSRNRYLSSDERALAPQLYQTLCLVRELLHQGHPRAAVEKAAVARLERAGFAPDYAVVRRGRDLGEPGPDEAGGLVALVAARLGKVRLIDCLPLD